MKNKLLFIFLVVVLLIIAIGVFYIFQPTIYPTLPVTDTALLKPIIIREYGIPVDSFEITQARVKRDETLAQILRKFNTPYHIINELILQSDHIFNLKHIKTGQKYTIFSTKDTNNVIQYLVYEHSLVDYVIFDMRDSLKVKVKQKETQYIRKTDTGIIKTNLWETMSENNINPNIALELSEIYAWTIDFFGLQKNDSFRVIYDEIYVDTLSVDIAQIIGAKFCHNGQAYFAVLFQQDSIWSYFDEKGNSLAKVFLKSPLRFKRISSRFSNRRLHPILKIRRPHFGVDYAASIGTPVHSIGDGTIIDAGRKGGEGNYIKIRHNSVYTSAYLHLNNFSKGVRQGVKVTQGQVIGYVGNTGSSTGPHLDFRVWKNGRPADPLKIESPPVEPVKKEYFQKFEQVKKEIIILLRGQGSVHI